MIQFRKYILSDNSKLYSMVSDTNFSNLVYSQEPINSYELFTEWIKFGMQQWNDFFIIEYNNEAIGYVYSYDYDKINQICKICVFMDKGHCKSTFGVKAGIIFIDYLFKKYPIRKIYSDVFSYNKRSLSTCLSVGFVEEGILKDYVFCNDKYYDQHILALDRNNYCKKVKELAERFSSERTFRKENEDELQNFKI